ncbi:hypothetical protein [Yimella sp. NH-Cas1]|uniref:hypothetical protein n=1 Tax=Yimella sp. NH-Cas1 TaxID=2917726 RepID=UPI001EFA3A20|nr:hypothetical protein [Yimella sp. NH-Cas1]MCG8656758.1 hypothetical protein [Yimella sp. NH-Cas1]
MNVAADEDTDDTWLCFGCGDCQVPDDQDECPECGFDRTALDPDDPHAGENAGFQFD